MGFKFNPIAFSGFDLQKFSSNGWTPILAVVTDGDRQVLQVTDWTGGEGGKPESGLYVGATGLTSNIAEAQDIKGTSGIAAASAPLQYDSGTNTVSITQANSTTDGYVSSTDWADFDNKLDSTVAYGDSLKFTSAYSVVYDMWKSEPSSIDIATTDAKIKVNEEVILDASPTGGFGPEEFISPTAISPGVYGWKFNGSSGPGWPTEIPGYLQLINVSTSQSKIYWAKSDEDSLAFLTQKRNNALSYTGGVASEIGLSTQPSGTLRYLRTGNLLPGYIISYTVYVVVSGNGYRFSFGSEFANLLNSFFEETHFTAVGSVASTLINLTRNNYTVSGRVLMDASSKNLIIENTRNDVIKLQTNVYSSDGKIDVSNSKIINVKAGTDSTDAVNVSQLGDAFGATSATGFTDASELSLSANIVGSDKIVTLDLVAPAVSSTYYVEGVKYTQTGSLSITLPNTTGLHFIYLDGSGSLISTTTFSQDIITKYAFVAVIYVDAVNNKLVHVGKELHGTQMGNYTHLYLHNTRGAQFDNGCRLLNFSVDGDGGQNAHADFTAGEGVIWDEDIKHTLPAQTDIPVLYKINTTWQKAYNAFPIIYNGAVLGDDTTYTPTRIAYNSESGGSWSLTEVDNNKFTLIHVFATNDINNPYVAILGINQYNTKTEARDGAATELQTLSGMPFLEFVPVGTVIYETNDAYTNTPKARVVSIDSKDYKDQRGIVFRPGTL